MLSSWYWHRKNSTM